MKKLLLILIIGLTGCSTVYFKPINPNNDYLTKIKSWQLRIRLEGWSDTLTDSIIKDSLKLSKYQPEPGNQDHWKTYKEFITNFEGDCEDIATFLYGTLKLLEYPNETRIRIIRMPAGDHAVLMVKLLDNNWKMYNSVPVVGDFIDLALSRPVVEWDDNQIYYF